MREFHLHLSNNDYSRQAFLFHISRDENHKTLQIHEIVIVTHCNGVETKSILNLDYLSDVMGQHKGGNLIPQSYPEVFELFHEMLGSEGKKTMENQMQIFKSNEFHSVEQLLNAAEVAKDLHPTLSIEEIVTKMLNKGVE